PRLRDVPVRVPGGRVAGAGLRGAFAAAGAGPTGLGSEPSALGSGAAPLGSGAAPLGSGAAPLGSAAPSEAEPSEAEPSARLRRARSPTQPPGYSQSPPGPRRGGLPGLHPRP